MKLSSYFPVPPVSFVANFKPSMSFKRRRAPTSTVPTSSPPLPPGVKISPNSTHPVTSWGHRSIDAALSGGILLHTLTIVTEDHPSSYYRPITSYIIAQGLQHDHTIAIASFDTRPQLVLNSIPAATNKDVSTHGYTTDARERADMKIAWRYQNPQQSHNYPNIIHGESTMAFASDFDLSQPPSIPSSAPISLLPTQSVGADTTPLSTLLSNLKLHLEKSTSQSKLTRVLITGLSPINPPSMTSSSASDISLTHFLVHLRSLLKLHSAIGVVTCSHDTPSRLQAVCADNWLELNSFNGLGGGVAGLGSEWLGVMVVRKIYHGLGRSKKGVGDVWVFKRGRRKYVFERATAAPEGDSGDGDGALLDGDNVVGGKGTTGVDF